MEFLTNLSLLIKEKGINNSVLSRESGVPYTTIDGFYKRGTGDVKLSTLKKLSAYFDVSIDYLIYGESATTVISSTVEPTEKESQLLSKYRILDDIDQGKIDERMDIMLEHEKYAVKKELLNA